MSCKKAKLSAIGITATTRTIVVKRIIVDNSTSNCFRNSVMELTACRS